MSPPGVNRPLFAWRAAEQPRFAAGRMAGDAAARGARRSCARAMYSGAGSQTRRTGSDTSPNQHQRRPD
eukprot:8781175-Pyramimonas_sp.AAC.1